MFEGARELFKYGPHHGFAEGGGGGGGGVWEGMCRYHSRMISYNVQLVAVQSQNLLRVQDRSRSVNLGGGGGGGGKLPPSG